ncbi:Alpha/Beta hydrolase protein, partial [Dimargaris cristalligena]
SKWQCQECDRITNSVMVKRFATKYQRTVGYVAINHDLQSVSLVFRGTLDIAQVLTDVKFKMKRWPKWVHKSRVHARFLESYWEVSDCLFKKIVELLLKYPEYHLTISGHSLGAALASIAAVDFIHRNQCLAEKVRVVTFGKPRVGNEAYIQHYNSLDLDSFSVVNKNDVVPHLPPRLLGYRHESGEVWIKPNCSDYETFFLPPGG